MGALNAVKQFLYAVAILFVMLIAGFTILNLARKHGPSITRRFATAVQRDASGAGLGVLQ